MKKNIAILINEFYGGGAERVAGLLSIALSKIYNIYIFIPDNPEIKYDYSGELVFIGKNEIEFKNKVSIYKKKYKIDCCISFMEAFNFINIATKGKDKVIISERTSPSLLKPYSRMYNEKIKKYYSYADEIVSCAYGVSYDLMKNIGVNTDITTIYNFIDKKKIIDLSKKNICDDLKEFIADSEYFISVGRLHPDKNHLRLIKQFNYFLCNYNKNIKLVILGSGQMKDEIKNLINHLNLNDNIMLIDFCPNPFPYIKNSKALILTSKREGLPNVLLETMILGIPIISTDCISGPRELIGDIYDYDYKLKNINIFKRGIVVTNSFSEDDVSTHYLADSMNIIATDKKYEETCRDNVLEYMENYLNDKILKKWISLIEKPSKKENKDISEYISNEKEILNKAEDIFIYGAGNVGKAVYDEISDFYNIKGFVITKLEEDKFLYGVPIIELKDLKKISKKPTIIIGVGEENQREILNKLYENDIENFIFFYF